MLALAPSPRRDRGVRAGATRGPPAGSAVWPEGAGAWNSRPAGTRAALKMSYMLPHLHNGWQVDQAILSEEDRVVVIRFGHDWDPTCMKMDEVLYSIAEKVTQLRRFVLRSVISLLISPALLLLVCLAVEFKSEVRIRPVLLPRAFIPGVQHIR